MQTTVLKLDRKDNVLIALIDLKKGDQVNFSGQRSVLLTDVPAKHKFALQDLAPGDPVLMYGVLVGRVVLPIRQGEVITTGNVRHDVVAFHELQESYQWCAPDVSKWRNRTFLGYLRPDGQVGTRNYWLVLPLVFCENRNLAVLKQAFEEELGFAAPQVYRRQVAEMVRLYREGKNDELQSFSFTALQPGAPSLRVFRNVDGIKFLMHEGGCG